MKVLDVLYDSSEFFYNHLPYVIAVLTGLISILVGLAYHSYQKNHQEQEEVETYDMD